MELLLMPIMAFLLGWIAFDDFKYRTIRVALLPVIFAILTLHRLAHESFALIMIQFLLNIAYVALLVLLVSIYLFLRHKTKWNQLSAYIGLGDLLFVFAISIWFDLEKFIVFIVGSLLAALIGTIVLGKRDATVPLAGYQSLCFLFLYLFSTIQW